jgi:hypothetical protein
VYFCARTQRPEIEEHHIAAVHIRERLDPFLRKKYGAQPIPSLNHHLVVAGIRRVPRRGGNEQRVSRHTYTNQPKLLVLFFFQNKKLTITKHESLCQSILRRVSLKTRGVGPLHTYKTKLRNR